ncbi:hypothetical protein RC52_25825 [Herbaspirillum rubrisubalbicans]|nr:hypothetical protein [Herbaspirillum rubrisubalbicans]
MPHALNLIERSNRYLYFFDFIRRVVKADVISAHFTLRKNSVTDLLRNSSGLWETIPTLGGKRSES